MSEYARNLRIAIVARNFLDYRVPVFRELNSLPGAELHFLFSRDFQKAEVTRQLEELLGDRAIGLEGEWCFGREDRDFLANRNVSVRWQPGLLKALRRVRADVLVGDGFFKWTFPALLHSVSSRVPLVVLYERTAHTERHAQWYRTAYRRCVVKLTGAMCCSGRLCAEYAESLGMPASRIVHGHQVADVQSFAARVGSVDESRCRRLREALRCDGTIFLYVGRLIPRKGCMELLRAWQRFCSDFVPSATLLFVGDGEQADELKHTVATQSIPGVRFAGAVPYEELPGYYRIADVFVMPTLEDNWSLVVPEAMACGLPVLCSQYNGCWPELVREGQNGWVFDPLAPEAASRLLGDIWTARSDLSRRGKESRRIVGTYTPASAARQILLACRMACGRPSRP